jgi:hypothetical protein
MAWILKRMFTPVRALKLERASVRVGAKLTSVSTWYAEINGQRIVAQITLNYRASNDCVSFWYTDQELDLWRAERQILEGLVVL